MNVKYILRNVSVRVIFNIGNILGVNKNKIYVICYHGISNSQDKYSISLDVFKKQINKIRQNNLKFINLQEFEDSLAGKKIKKTGVFLTIDDGYKSVNKIVPYISKNKIPVMLFVMAKKDRVNRKELESNEKLLTFKEIKKLKRAGFFIGCHSATHPDFKNLSQKEIEKEIIASKKLLERKLGFRVDYFAYPKGVFSNKLIKIVKKAGYKAAFAVKSGHIASSENRFALPRVVVDKTYKLSDIPGAFSYSWFAFRNFTDKIRLYERIYKI
jgi:peptidoglycan/xylan/chitin deacetylase (PgdA/CDA1 family)